MKNKKPRLFSKQETTTRVGGEHGICEKLKEATSAGECSSTTTGECEKNPQKIL